MLLKEHAVYAQVRYTTYVFMKILEGVLCMLRKPETPKLFAA